MENEPPLKVSIPASFADHYQVLSIDPIEGFLIDLLLESADNDFLKQLETGAISSQAIDKIVKLRGFKLEDGNDFELRK